MSTKIQDTVESLSNEIDSCQCCGINLEQNRQEQCGDCGKQGPFCEKCYVHHLKHCRGEEVISDNESCSECDEDAEYLPKAGDDDIEEDDEIDEEEEEIEPEPEGE